MRSFVGTRSKLVKVWDLKLANFDNWEVYARGQNACPLTYICQNCRI